MTQRLQATASFVFLAVLVLPAAGAPLFQATGPLGYWKLDETAGPAVDSISGANGTWVGAVAGSTDLPPQITTPGPPSPPPVR